MTDKLVIDFDITEERIEIEVDNVKIVFIVTPLTVENANLIATYYTGMVVKKDIEPEKFLRILKKIVKDQVVKIEGIDVKENGEVRKAVPSDLTKHAGFYQITMELMGKLNNISSISKDDEENFPDPLANGLLTEESENPDT